MHSSFFFRLSLKLYISDDEPSKLSFLSLPLLTHIVCCRSHFPLSFVTLKQPSHQLLLLHRHLRFFLCNYPQKWFSITIHQQKKIIYLVTGGKKIADFLKSPSFLFITTTKIAAAAPPPPPQSTATKITTATTKMMLFFFYSKHFEGVLFAVLNVISTIIVVIIYSTTTYVLFIPLFPPLLPSPLKKKNRRKKSRKMKWKNSNKITVDFYSTIFCIMSFFFFI